MIRGGAPTCLIGLMCIALTASPAPAPAQTPTPPLYEDQRAWNNVADLLRAVEPAYANAAARSEARRAVEAQLPDDQLRWSGEAGLLIVVRFQVPATGGGAHVRLGNPVLLGVGASPSDAAAASMFDPPLLEPADAGMIEATQDAFFVWASLDGNRLRYRRLTPAESVVLKGRVTLRLKASLSAARERRARTARIVGGVATYLARSSGQGPSSGAIAATSKGYSNARTRLDEGEQHQADWSDWARRSDAAFAAVDTYRNILTLPGLRQQASVFARGDLAETIRRAATPVALSNALKSDRDTLRAQLAALDVNALCLAELDAYNAFFAAIALTGDDRALVRKLLPGRSDTPCLTPQS